MLELMHFANELVDVDEFKLPVTHAIGKKELQMAESLIDSMSDKWKPEEYVDDYQQALEKVIEEKIEKGDRTAPKPARRVKPTNVIDLVSVLQRSLDQTGKRSKKSRASEHSKKAKRKAA
jgi:DNA end-binding protein Ku